MKRLCIFGVLLLSSLICFSQTSIVLDFEILQNGSQLVLDSVLVENTSNSTDTMIYKPDTSIELDMLSGIDENIAHSSELEIVRNYMNTMTNKSFIEVYCPAKELYVRVFDVSGKTILKKKLKTDIGVNIFEYSPGRDTQTIVSFSLDNIEKSVKLIHHGGKGRCNIECRGVCNDPYLKSEKSPAFTYTEGEELQFTSYTTACNIVETAINSASPAGSETISFDYTNLLDLQPESPVVSDGAATETDILWNWEDVSGADGYKYNTVDEYETATDLGAVSELQWTGLSAGKYYILYVWAYNDCGESFPVQMVKATETTALTQEENDLITSGSASQDFELMYICEQPDSIILRTPSINIDLDEENIQLLTDRLKTTVLGEGVGIAAPQIGINRNVIWVQRYDAGGAVKPWEVYYNPVIIRYSDTVALRNDGCLSVPGDCVSEYGIQGNSYRAVWIDVQYYDEDFNLVQERITHQFTAHIFQHEIDHLNGVMYFDRQVDENPEKYVIIEEE